jgi:adenylate cyclase
MADVFVSYSRSDKTRVAPLVAAIKAKGWSVWWDPSIAAGQQFDDQIEAQLLAASAVLVVWTPASVVSRWVRGEARDAAERDILVPVRFDGARLPIDARAIQTTDLDDWKEDPASAPFQHMLRSLTAVIERQRASAPAATSAASVPPAGAPRVAICVLPFANMSGDPEQEYFSDGITEDIITDLSKVSALAVVSRNSAFMYKGKNVDVMKVARELKVGHVLEGSVRKAGGRVRITAQLVDGSTNDHVWAERYDRDLNDIFTLQDEISEAIVTALKFKLLPTEKKAIEHRGTENVEAYNLYLMARQAYVTGYDADPRRGQAIVRLGRRATEIDPGYSQAWALLAIGQMILRFDVSTGRESDDGLDSAERALALDVSLPEAHAVKAKILAEYGRHDEAAAEINVALRLSPESYEVNRAAAYLRFRQQRVGEAIRYYEKSMSLMDTDLNSGSMLLTCYGATGNEQASLQTARTLLARVEKMLVQDPNNATAMGSGALALGVLGQGERAREWINRALLMDPDNMNARYNFACSLTSLFKQPDMDAALELLAPVFETVASGFLDHTKVDPDLNPLRENPRFQAMVAAAEARLATASNASATGSSGQR